MPAVKRNAIQALTIALAAKMFLSLDTVLFQVDSSAIAMVAGGLWRTIAFGLWHHFSG